MELFLIKRLSDDVKDGFGKDGLFSVKLSEGDSNCVWLNYTLETTEKKALKC